jgi:hypothetical protein
MHDLGGSLFAHNLQLVLDKRPGGPEWLHPGCRGAWEATVLSCDEHASR